MGRFLDREKRKLENFRRAVSRFLLLEPRHRLRTTKETIQPNNKALRRTLLFGFFGDEPVFPDPTDSS